ncbi:hypothetical protein Trydic_g20850 [Trypoxylus dichotomus]
MSLLGAQRLQLGTKKLHWLHFWTLKAPLARRPSCQWSGVCKDVKSSQPSPGATAEGRLPAGQCVIAFALMPTGG